VFDRAFDAGEKTTIRYTVQLPDTAEVRVQGFVRTTSPEVSARSDGADRIAADVAEPSVLAAEDGSIVVVRTVESVDGSGLAVVGLTIRADAAFDGLVLHETLSDRAEIRSLEAGGAQFDTINRSNAGWIVLSHDRIVLEPGESRDVVVHIDAPDGIEGTYWSAVFVESRPRIVEQAGTRVLGIYRAAVKVYVTALGTGAGRRAAGGRDLSGGRSLRLRRRQRGGRRPGLPRAVTRPGVTSDLSSGDSRGSGDTLQAGRCV